MDIAHEIGGFQNNLLVVEFDSPSSVFELCVVRVVGPKSRSNTTIRTTLFASVVWVVSLVWVIHHHAS